LYVIACCGLTATKLHSVCFPDNTDYVNYLVYMSTLVWETFNQ